MAVHIQFTHFSYDDCENMCTLWYNHHHEIGSMTHLPLFRAMSWNNGMCSVSFYILISRDKPWVYNQITHFTNVFSSNIYLFILKQAIKSLRIDIWILCDLSDIILQVDILRAADCQWTESWLVQVMSLDVRKHCPNQCWSTANWTPGTYLSIIWIKIQHFV